MNNQQASRHIVVVGASAGGMDALIKPCAGLPAHLAASIFVVLHIPPESPSELAAILARAGRLPVKEAEDLESIDPGQIYVASSDRHLMIEGHRIRVTRGPRESQSRPSIDVLFRSASVSFGERVIAVMLSGTLDDGTAGAWAVKDRGGLVLVQEPSDATHASMPESVIQHVKVDHVGTAQELGNVIARLVSMPVSAEPSKPSHGHSVENLIAMEGNGLKAGVMDLGKVSKYACPDCHGVLVEIEEGPIVRFRCHTGHAFSLMSLLA